MDCSFISLIKSCYDECRAECNKHLMELISFLKRDKFGHGVCTVCALCVKQCHHLFQHPNS